MEVGLLYSGGRDSTLAALILEPFCSVTLLCGTFGITDDHEHARAAGAELGLSTRQLSLDPAVAQAAADRIVADGYPRNGIQHVHEHALERAAETGVDAVADGTRRDDRAPTVERSLAQSIEDRYDVAHMAPLAGLGRRAIDAFAEAALTVETGRSEQLPSGDYEGELRALIETEYDTSVETLFPTHTQSRVTGTSRM